MVKKLQNEGTSDRIIRFVLGVAFALMGYFYLSGVMQYVAYAVAAVVIVTSVTGVCLLYKVFGIDTRGKK